MGAQHDSRLLAKAYWQALRLTRWQLALYTAVYIAVNVFVMSQLFVLDSGSEQQRQALKERLPWLLVGSCAVLAPWIIQSERAFHSYQELRHLRRWHPLLGTKMMWWHLGELVEEQWGEFYWTVWTLVPLVLALAWVVVISRTAF